MGERYANGGGLGVPNHWHVYFAIADADATAEAAELGGSALIAPFDTPAGRIAPGP